MNPRVSDCYPTRSTLHHACAGARDLSDWLAHLRLKNRADRTLDDYERTIAASYVETSAVWNPAQGLTKSVQTPSEPKD